MFKFRLQELLDLRKTQRDQRRAELAQAFDAESVLRQQQSDLRTEQQQVEQKIRQASQPGSVYVEGLLDAHRYELLLRSQLLLLQQRSDQVAQEIERRRQRLVDADRDVRVVEKLRDRHQARFRASEAKQESRHLDDLAACRSRPAEGLRWER